MKLLLLILLCILLSGYSCNWGGGASGLPGGIGSPTGGGGGNGIGDGGDPDEDDDATTVSIDANGHVADDRFCNPCGMPKVRSASATR